MPRVIRFFRTGLRKKPRVALAVGLAIFAAVVLYTYTRPKISEATASVVLLPRSMIQVIGPADSLVCGITCGEDLNTVVKVIESTLMARRVAKHLSASEKSLLLHHFKASSEMDDDDDRLIDALKRSHSVQKSEPNTQIRITARHRDPAGAARVATLYASEMKTWMEQIEADETMRALEDLRIRIEQARKLATEQGEALATYLSSPESGGMLRSTENPIIAAKRSEFDASQERLDQLIQRYKGVSANPPNIAERVTIIPAEIPALDAYVSPNIPLHLGVGLLASLALGSLAAAFAARAPTPLSSKT